MSALTPSPPSTITTTNGGLFSALGQLARLELELGLAEVRDRVRTAVIALVLAAVAAIALVASLVLLIAAAIAPLFGAAWEHLVVAGGGVLLLAIGALAWSAWRLRRLDWPPRLTLASLEENWEWLGAQLRSRLTWP
jgi:cytochrome c biogenesis protein CcdA